jgi:hypothetical protein
MHVPLWKNIFRHRTRSSIRRKQRAHLRLHVGRETGIGFRNDFQRAGIAVGQDGNGIACDIHGVTALCKRISDRTHVFGLHAFYRHALPSDCACDQKCAGFNSVRNNAVFRAVQLRHAFDDDPVRPGPFDLCPHFVEETCQVHDLGFASCSFNDSHAIGQDCCHHHVVCAEHSRTEFSLHVDLCPAQFGRKNLDITAFHAHR